MRSLARMARPYVYHWSPLAPNATGWFPHLFPSRKHSKMSDKNESKKYIQKQHKQIVGLPHVSLSLNGSTTQSGVLPTNAECRCPTPPAAQGQWPQVSSSQSYTGTPARVPASQRAQHRVQEPVHTNAIPS